MQMLLPVYYTRDYIIVELTSTCAISVFQHCCFYLFIFIYLFVFIYLFLLFIYFYLFIYLFLFVQSMPITITIVSSNPVHGELYNIM